MDKTTFSNVNLSLFLKKALLTLTCLTCPLSPLQASIPLFENLNSVVHPVSTKNEKAAQFFNQGLAFYYSFNSEASYSSFEEAAKLDPEMSMAYWGMALSLGPIQSTTIPIEREYQAYELIQKALKLSSNASPYEKSYIQALAVRYSDSPNPDFKQLAINYREAMKKLSESYPDDLDAASLYAESAMNLDVDHLWKKNGEPNEGTAQIVSILESVLKRDPDHIGANHYYIHTMETSTHPDRAITSADHLTKVNPILTHLVHAPSHIYLAVGDYKAAIAVNEKSIIANQEYLKQYNDKKSVNKIAHNMLYLVRSYTMAGRFKEAKKSADDLKGLYKDVSPSEASPMIQINDSTLLFVLIRFQAWQDILNEPAPPPEMKLATTIWHLARAIAYASLGQQQLALQEQQAAEQNKEPVDEELVKSLEILTLLLDAKLAVLKNDNLKAIELLQKAVSIQDPLKEECPFDWILVLRENLGELQLKLNRPQEAEKIFREDLDKHPRNGRSLKGLFESLQAQSQDINGFWIKQAFYQTWEGEDPFSQN